ncbi:MAG TPA: hypothetical protein VFO21_08035 [Vicinamibacterales bacterium]|jgi:hypothetical protein|nr:hypothetical protein [Vicinamibacterales bacterium]
MKTFLKLLVVAAVVNGAYRFGMAEYRFSQLKESTHSVLALGANTPIEQLKDQILSKATDLNLPVSGERVSLARENLRTTAAVSYQQDVEYFPGLTYPRQYSFTDEIAPIR